MSRIKTFSIFKIDYDLPDLDLVQVKDGFESQEAAERHIYQLPGSVGTLLILPVYTPDPDWEPNHVSYCTCEYHTNQKVNTQT